MAGESCTWKKFYADRKHKYRTKFPFLKEDQITAKLKRIWSREKGKSSYFLLTRTIGSPLYCTAVMHIAKFNHLTIRNGQNLCKHPLKLNDTLNDFMMHNAFVCVCSP